MRESVPRQLSNASKALRTHAVMIEINLERREGIDTRGFTSTGRVFG